MPASAARSDSHEPAVRRQAVFESRAIKRQRDRLEERKRRLLHELVEVNSNLEVVQQMKQRTRRSSLCKFEPEADVVFTVPMAPDDVAGRLMTAETRRALIANMRQVAVEARRAVDESPTYSSTGEANSEERAGEAESDERGGSSAELSERTSQSQDGAAPSASATARADELLAVQIRAIMMQHAEDCKRMHASDAGRLAMESMAQLRGANKQ